MLNVKTLTLLLLIPLSSSAFAAIHTSPDYLRAVSPALAKYSSDVLDQDVWKRPALSVRDRSLITLSAMIARDQLSELKDYTKIALDNGVKPSEISETITQLAFYAGRDNAMNAAKVAYEVFKERQIDMSTMPPSSPDLAVLDPHAEAQRLKAVKQLFGDTGRPLSDYTTSVLFRNLWLRPGLTPRDRSLVTVSALIATGNSAQMPLHLRRAMHYGLSEQQAEELIAQLAFYTGWPNSFAAQSVATAVFKENRH